MTAREEHLTVCWTFTPAQSRLFRLWVEHSYRDVPAMGEMSRDAFMEMVYLQLRFDTHDHDFTSSPLGQEVLVALEVLRLENVQRYRKTSGART